MLHTLFIPYKSGEQGRAVVVCCAQFCNLVVGNIEAGSSMAVYAPPTYTPVPSLDISTVSPVDTVPVVLPINKNGSVPPELVVLKLDLVQLLLGGLVRDVSTRDHGVLLLVIVILLLTVRHFQRVKVLSSFTISSPLITCILLQLKNGSMKL
jgi:hypothetical protein